MTNEELALKIQSGEQDLMTQLWEQNQGIVNQKAYKLFSLYCNRCASCGVELDDIIQICFFALRDAVQAYQPERGYKLLSYLKFPLLNHFNSLVGIRGKRNLLDQCKSLNETSGEDNDLEYIDLLADPNSEESFEDIIDNQFQSELRETLEKSISKLPANRADVIRKRYFEGETLQEIAAKRGVNSSYIRQLEVNALRKLRQDLTLQSFHDEILSRWAYRGTGLTSFKENWESSVERAVIKMEELIDRRRKVLSRFDKLVQEIHRSLG